MTLEDGAHYVANEVKESDLEAIGDGILTVIRCSDAKECDVYGNFTDLPKWKN